MSAGCPTCATLNTSTLFPFSAGPTFAEACRDRLASIWQREAGPDVPFPAAAEQLGWRNGNPPIARLAGLLCQPALQCRAERAWNPCCRVTLLAGFRWIDLRENLAGALEPPTVPGEAPFWDTTTTNNLYGFQIGADGKLFERGRLVRGVGRVVVNRPIGELDPNHPVEALRHGRETELFPAHQPDERMRRRRVRIVAHVNPFELVGIANTATWNLPVTLVGSVGTSIQAFW